MVTCATGFFADLRNHVLLEGPAPVRRGALSVPAGAARRGSDVVEATEGQTLFLPGVAAGASNPAVVEGDTSRLGKPDKRKGTQAKVMPLPLDDKALHEVA